MKYLMKKTEDCSSNYENRLRNVFHQVFRLSQVSRFPSFSHLILFSFQFRCSQHKAIIVALQHHGCFILIPTGTNEFNHWNILFLSLVDRGKSLCYQLSAVIDNDVTFAIAPLRSLIFDRKQRLNVLNIPCAALTRNISEEEADEIFRDWYRDLPIYKIVFITSEKISLSGSECFC